MQFMSDSPHPEDISLQREDIYAHLFSSEPVVSPDLVPLSPRINVYQYRDHPLTKSHILVTEGMSDYQMNCAPDGVPRRCELLMYVEEIKPAYVDLLRFLARLPSEENTWISHGSTMTNGQPPQPIFVNSELDCFLFIDAPIPEEHVFSLDGDRVALLLVIPVTTAECDLVRSDGLEALGMAFRARDFDCILDETRPSCIQSLERAASSKDDSWDDGGIPESELNSIESDAEVTASSGRESRKDYRGVSSISPISEAEFWDQLLFLESMCFKSGHPDAEMDAVFVKSWDEAIESLTSEQWRKFLDARQQGFWSTGRVEVIHGPRAEFEGSWSGRIVTDQRRIQKLLRRRIDDSSIPEEYRPILADYLQDLLMHGLREITYDYLIESSFFIKATQLILHGYLPCGYNGEYPNGKFVVY
jgi:hypothetical protein